MILPPPLPPPPFPLAPPPLPPPLPRTLPPPPQLNLPPLPAFSARMSPTDRFGAVFVLTDWPLISYDQAVKDLHTRCVKHGFDDISLASFIALYGQDLRAWRLEGIDPNDAEAVHRRAIAADPPWPKSSDF